MSKSIADYIDFTAECGDFKKYSIKSLKDKDITIKKWVFRESSFKDKFNPEGIYARIELDLNGENCYCNVSSYPILLQLRQIEEEKKKANEDDMSFTCCIKGYGASYKLMPIGWVSKK